MQVRTISLSALCMALSACASTSVTGGEAALDGLGSDTRVFLDDTCLPQEGAGALDPYSTIGEIAVGVGGAVFGSFGRYIEELGQPDLDASMGLASDFFYEPPADAAGVGFPFEDEEAGAPDGPSTRNMNRFIKCVHVVRSGFEPGPRPDPGNPAYGHLGLTSRPALYALIELVPAPDRSAFFRGELRHLEVNRFERAGGELSRDLVISLELGAPASARIVALDEFGIPEAIPGGAFAIAAFQLPGVEGGRVLGEAETKGLVTAWMNAPPESGEGDQFPFNLYVDIVELKRGNPLLQDIGRVLQSTPVQQAVEYDLREGVYGDSERRRGRRTDDFERRATERRLVRALEDEIRRLEDLVEGGETDEETLIGQIRSIEDAIEDIERAREIDGWETASPDILMRRAQLAVDEADAAMQQPGEE